MNYDNIDNIVSTTIMTIDAFKKHKNGGNALLLYFEYIKHSRIQKTNQAWCTDEFMMNGLNWGKEKLVGAKKILKDLGLIEFVQEKKNDGTFSKMYVKVNYMIKNRLTENPGHGEPSTNALSVINLNAGSVSNIDQPFSSGEENVVHPNEEQSSTNIDTVDNNNHLVDGLVPDKKKRSVSDKPKQKSESKDKYGILGNVELTKKEYDQLIEWYGKEETNLMIEDVDVRIPNATKKVKSAYATIINWFNRRKTPKKNSKHFSKMNEDEFRKLLQDIGTSKFLSDKRGTLKKYKNYEMMKRVYQEESEKESNKRVLGLLDNYY